MSDNLDWVTDRRISVPRRLLYLLLYFMIFFGLLGVAAWRFRHLFNDWLPLWATGYFLAVGLALAVGYLLGERATQKKYERLLRDAEEANQPSLGQILSDALNERGLK